ncbi:MAG: exosome complex protein Rrp42 [Candidatus Micrarchaeaceae archaeon]
MNAIDYVNSKYIRELASKKIREDGRESLAYREISVAKRLIGNAEGSAQVDIGATRVMAGVKMVVESPMEDTPDLGNLIVSAELLPLASPDFESGPPSPESIELARVVDRGIRAAECIDLGDLLIEEGKAWSVYIDLYILNYSGNLFDASTLAAMSALLNTKVPAYRDGKAIMNERSTPLKINNVVSSCTFAKIGNTIFLDPSINEEKAADARMTIATDGKVIRAMQKGLSGSFSRNEISEIVEVALSKHSELKAHIEKG